MSASIDIIGIEQKVLLEKLPDSFVEVKEKYLNNELRITVKELYFLFYNSLFENLHDSERGLILLFENSIKHSCFLLNEMMLYYFSGFNWNNNEVDLDSYNASHILDRNQMLGLIDWYIALSVATNKRRQTDSTLQYLSQAKYIINTYYEDVSDIEFFEMRSDDFMRFKDKVQCSNFDYYFYTYSF